MRKYFPLLTLSLMGCSTTNHEHALVNQPPVIENSLDYVRPFQVEGKGRPAYLMPQTSWSWEKARQDPQTGQWLGGRYVGTVVEPARLATMEEAEMSGRPYIIFGEQGIIPSLIGSVPSSADGEEVINTKTTRRDFAKLPQNLAPISASADADHDEIDSSSSAAKPVITDLGNGRARIEVPVLRAGQSISLQTPSGHTAVIEFLPDKMIRATYRGKTAGKSYRGNDDRVALTVQD